jgi:MoaA/NifB/PqqE/SkfB family radical SAM enzyme
MNSMFDLLARVPLFKLYRATGWPKMLPLNLTLSPSPKCNSRCLTCNIWMKRENELTIEEWEKVLASLGQSPYWFTISGGEPLMYPHVVELAELAYKYCKPGVINIPTNAILPIIPERVEKIGKACPDSQLIINLSLDGVGKKHDYIRGIPGNFEKFEERLKQLLELKKTLPNLVVGIHSVVSVFSVGHLDELISYADGSGADQFITEIAEPRVELDTVGLPITPNKADYSAAIDRLIAYVQRRQFSGISRITEAFREEYYKLVKSILEVQDQVIDCYAGWVSAQIYADGTVWPCCVRADRVGNLRDHDYDFKKIWFGENIKEVRRSIAAKECHCPLANASYTNMLHDIPTLTRVFGKVIGLGGHKPQPTAPAAMATAPQSQGSDGLVQIHPGAAQSAESDAKMRAAR